MFYKLEWQTPHETPHGLTVPEYVEDVKAFEAKGWLRDPEEISWPKEPDHPANVARASSERLCLMLCWRERCRRAERCRHRLPLGVRDWMPELSVHLSALQNEPQIYFGPVNPDKMAVLAEIFGPLETAPPNKPDKDHFLKPCDGPRPPLFESREAFEAATRGPA
jgi:hypothetical protein